MKDRYIGMVLSAATIGEYDKRVVLLTRENGRFSAFARGARRPRSSLSAVTEPFCFGEFYVYRGRDSYTIEEVKASNFFPELRKDLDRLYMGLYLCEVADYFTREGMRAKVELELLYRALLALETTGAEIGSGRQTQSGSGTQSETGGTSAPKPVIRPELVRRIYELRMLAIAGYAPYYSDDDKAWHDDLGAWHLTDTAAYTVGQILTRALPDLFTFAVSDGVLTDLDRCIGAFFKRNTDKTFHSLDALEK